MNGAQEIFDITRGHCLGSLILRAVNLER